MTETMKPQVRNDALSFEALQVRIAQANTELREPAHHREDQVSGGDTILGTHTLHIRGFSMS